MNKYLAFSLKCESLGITPARFRSWFKNKNTTNENGTIDGGKKKMGVLLGVIVAILAAIGLILRAEKDHPKQEIPKRFRNSRSRPVYIEGGWYPGWLLAIVPFLTVGIVWFRSVFKKKLILQHFQ